MGNELITEKELTFTEEFKKILKPTKTTLLFLLPLFIINIIYSIFYTENDFQRYSLIIAGIFMLMTSIQDLNDKEVISFLLPPIYVSSFFYITYNNNDHFFTMSSYIFNNLIIGGLTILIMYSLSLFLSVLLRKDTMGTGDYPVFFAMGIILNTEIGIGMLIMSFSAIIYKIITKEEFIPLIPFIYFSIISTLYLKEFVL